MTEWIINLMYKLFGWPVPKSVEDRIKFLGHWRRNRMNAELSFCDHYLDDKDVCRYCGKEFMRLR